MKTEKKISFELSFDEWVLIKLGLNELRKSYILLVNELNEEDMLDGSADFMEAITRIDKLDSILHL